jgi:hypothetical protein
MLTEERLAGTSTRDATFGGSYHVVGRRPSRRAEEVGMNAVVALEQEQQPNDDDLRRMVGPDPHRPGPDRARLIEQGVPVWAIIGHLLAMNAGTDPLDSSPQAIAQVAEDYRIPTSAVAAALLYYAEHRAAIDTRLAINAAGV